MSNAIPLSTIVEMRLLCQQTFDAAQRNHVSMEVRMPLAQLNGVLNFWADYLAKDIKVEVTA